MTNPLPRQITPRRWTSLAIVGAAASLAFAGSMSAEQSPVNHKGATLWLAQVEGGEGGEGGEAGPEIEAMKGAEFLTAIALMEGHLRVGFALYAEGRADRAVTHMKHPKDEIYTDVEPAFAAYGVSGFADELAALADTVKAQKPFPEVEAAYLAVMQKTSAARAGAGLSDRLAFDAIIAVVRVAAEEHAIGVVDGKIANLHEYQDAWGFVETAKLMAQSLAASADAKISEAAKKALAALDGTSEAFAGLVPEAVAGQGDVLLAAASAIELAAYGVK